MAWHDRPPFSWPICILIGIAMFFAVWGVGLWFSMTWYTPLDHDAQITRAFMFMYGLVAVGAARTFPR